MKYIEPPSQPKPKDNLSKELKESEEELRDRRIGKTVGILIVITIALFSIFGYVLYLLSQL